MAESTTKKTNESTTIKISSKVRDKLTDLKIDNEGYSVVIARLIEENKQLKEDKVKLLNAVSYSAVANSDVRTYTEIIKIIVDGSSENKLQELKNYFNNEKLMVEPIEVNEAVENVKKQYVNNDVPSVLIDFEAYINDVD